MYGYDIDPNHILLTKFVFLKHWMTNVVPYDTVTVEAMLEFIDSLLNIQQKNFLLEGDPTNSKYDLCIGNPPYIRHHGINKKKIIESLVDSPEYQSVFAEKNQHIDSKADLYFYFWIKLMFNLNPKGVLGLVLSRSWYSSRFLNPINRLLFEKYLNLDLILELPSEPWETAEIITNIIIGHKIEHFEEVQTTTVLVWKETLSKLLGIPESLSAYIEGVEKEQSKIITDVSVKSYETNEYRMSQISNPHLLFSPEQSQLIPVLRIDYFTMAPFFLHHVLLANRNKFCMLSQLGKLSLGSTTGANKFFYLTDEIIETFSLCKKYLVAMTKSPKDNVGISTVSPKKPLFLLCVPSDTNPEEDNRLNEYLESQKAELLSRPYFRNKSKTNWYRIAKIQPDIIIPNMTYLRSFVAYNKQKYHIDKQWIGFWPNNPAWTEFLLGFMNSSLGMLLREIQGTRTLGLGSLKLSLKECKNLLVLDPRLIPENILHKLRILLEQLSVLPIPRIGEKTKYSLIQRKMDQLICVEYLGLTPHIVNQIRESIKFEVEWRLGKPIS
jgi:hypothetical protein